jgi:4-hydroxy-4-methyl-2-oxoglutarate aldolase
MAEELYLADEVVPSAAHLEALREFGTATVHEAAKDSVVFPIAIVPIVVGGELCGPAFTVEAGPGDNLWIHRAIYQAPPGSILIVTCGGDYEYGYWGEILSVAAASRNLGGAVIDGCVRDSEPLQQVGLPIFGRGLCVRGTAKQPRANCGVGQVVAFPSGTVRPRDIVIGDADGLISVPPDNLDVLVGKAQERIDRERQVIERLRGGERSLDLLGIGP